MSPVTLGTSQTTFSGGDGLGGACQSPLIASPLSTPQSLVSIVSKVEVEVGVAPGSVEVEVGSVEISSSCLAPSCEVWKVWKVVEGDVVMLLGRKVLGKVGKVSGSPGKVEVSPGKVMVMPGVVSAST